MSWYIIKDFPYGDFTQHVNIIRRLAGNNQLVVRKEEWKYENGQYPIEYEKLYPKEKFCFRKHIRSFRNILFDGEIDNDKYDWYYVIDFEHLYKLIRDNNFYNIIIMNHTNCTEPHLYHLNYVENCSMFLAINSPKDNLPELLHDFLSPKYSIIQYKPNMEL